MKKFLFICQLLLLWHQASFTDPNIEEENIRATAYMKLLNDKNTKLSNYITIVSWDFESNITDENEKKFIEASAHVAKEVKEDWLQTIKFDWQSFNDADLKRQFKKYSILGTAALPEEKYVKLQKTKSEMQKIYATAKICDFKNASNCELSLEPEITNILINSRDPEELKHVWVEWRKKTSAAKELFNEYVILSNEAARLNNFSNNADFWLHDYEDPNFKNIIKKLWEQIKPLYLQIHAYVRTKLRQRYGDTVSEKGPIPAHLLGNMWSQDWSNVADITLPYQEFKNADISAEMVKQGYTPQKMFKMAEEFFVSLGLSPMTPTFWKRSIIEKPSDGRNLMCHASAWDFYDGEDFRIKQCTSVTFEDFTTAHHEMGHIEYYLQYKNQPVVYREGANDGFHEAVGDIMSLSVSTTKHLKAIGLIKSDTTDSDEADLNNLYKIGLEKIVFLPFAFLMDQWRWAVFDGSISPDEYNTKWWEFITEIQGIEPPVDRSEADFDPAAKYHILADVPYIRYFISFVVQFQFHRAACEISKQYIPNDLTKPLHKCDIYQSKEAGNAIGRMLQMGSSRPWPDAMEALTGQREMNANSLLEYFRPLQKWLEAENKRSNAHIGWEPTQRKIGKTT